MEEELILNIKDSLLVGKNIGGPPLNNNNSNILNLLKNNILLTNEEKECLFKLSSKFRLYII